MQASTCCRAPLPLLLASGPLSSTMGLPAAQLLGGLLLRPWLMWLSGLSVDPLPRRPLLDELGQRLCWRCGSAPWLLAEGERAAGAGARLQGESALRLCWGEADWAGVRCCCMGPGRTYSVPCDTEPCAALLGACRDTAGVSEACPVSPVPTLCPVAGLCSVAAPSSQDSTL